MKSKIKIAHLVQASAFSLLLLLSGCKKDVAETNTNSSFKDSDKTTSSASARHATPSPAVQTARPGVAIAPHINGFYEYLPEGYANNKSQYPLLVCFHGGGEVGNGTSDLNLLLKYGPAKMINDGTFPTSFTVDGKSYKMLIMSPQQTENGVWPEDYDKFIEYCKANYRVDAKRIYVIGPSTGGANCWNYAGYSTATAGKIAAMVPICPYTQPGGWGEVDGAEVQRIASANIGVWQTHNYGDLTSRYTWTVEKQNMMENANPAPNPLPKITCFNSDSHDAWTATYDPAFKESGYNVYEWLLRHSKGTRVSTLTPDVPLTRAVIIKSSNNKYWQNPGGALPVNSNSTSFGTLEKFVVVDAGHGLVALQNLVQYVTISNPSSLSCQAVTVGPNEIFEWVRNADGSVSLKGSNGKYASQNNGALSCLAETIGENEKFKINR